MRFQPPRPRSNEERILPLINVVFLLLIFFMIAGRLAASDPFRIEPPRSASEGSVEPRALMVLVGSDGRLALGGEVMDAEALKAALEDRMEGETAPDVRLKADGLAEAAQVVSVMELLRDAGVKKLKLLTVPSQGRQP